MATISRAFGTCRILLTKAAATPAVTGAETGKAGKAIRKTRPVSEPLAKFAGESELSHPGAVKKVWEHIRLNNLQNPENKTEIQCDEKLKTIFEGKDKIVIREIFKLLSPHFIKKSD